MTKTTISIAALTLAIAAVSTGAFAKQNANTVTAQLNQQQLQGMPMQTQQPAQNPTANQQYTSDASTQPTPDTRSDVATNVIVAGPAHDSSSFGQPDTSPQSTGTPSTDTPYVAVVPAPNGQTDDSPAPSANGN